MKNKIIKAIEDFKLNLCDRTVLTEAATGNYVVTPIIAAVAGADVIAYTKESKYGSIEEVYEQTVSLASQFGIEENIKIVTDLSQVNLHSVDVLTNTGFLRPITKELIDKLPSNCVIPLMWEPWEFRKEDLDIDACVSRGIKVYGTNESDHRLRTIEYLGDIVIKLLEENERTILSENILLLGCEQFAVPVANCLSEKGFSFDLVIDYSHKVDPHNYTVFVLLELLNPIELIGGATAYINENDLAHNSLIFHISGALRLEREDVKCIPDSPAQFGYMSFTTDYLDNKAVIDLHTAGLKVAEGMLKANSLKLKGDRYKNFLETNYPALSFDSYKFW